MSDLAAPYISSLPPSSDIAVLCVGAAIGLASIPYLIACGCPAAGIAVVDQGPLDVLTHMAHTRFPREPLIRLGGFRVRGKLVNWGVSAPRPPSCLLSRWPYELGDLLAKFAAVEADLGVLDPTPKADLLLESRIRTLLGSHLPGHAFPRAPLAINRDGRRWCPLDRVPELTQQGVRLAPQHKCVRFERTGSRISAVVLQNPRGRQLRLRPRYVALGVGVEASIPLLAPVCPTPPLLAAADHIRIDAHATLPQGAFGDEPADDLGIAVLCMPYRSREHGIPAHFEIKVAPQSLWARGYMQSHDNLKPLEDQDRMLVQIQCVSAMHDRLPATDHLRVSGPLAPVMSYRDVKLHDELADVVRDLMAALGVGEPRFCLRPLLHNHHTYGAYRVGKAVSPSLRFLDLDNLYVLPPTSYVDLDDDANPTLKSLVLARYAFAEIAARLARGRRAA